MPIRKAMRQTLPQIRTVIRLNLSRRWWAIWLLLLGLSAIVAGYFDHGTPASWPAFAREATEIFLVPGGLVWMALFWHAFDSGPTEAGQVIIVLANATLWSLAAYTASRISCWLSWPIPKKEQPAERENGDSSGPNQTELDNASRNAERTRGKA